MLQTALDRVSREQSLRAVQETTESMAAAESVTEVCDILATRAAETFDLPVVAVWEHRTPENVLDPVASSEEATTLLEEVPTFDAGEAIAWEVFESGAPEIVDHLDRRGDAHDSEGELASEIIVPIGDFGVVAAGSTLRADFSQEDMETLQALAAGAESAVRIVEQREELATLDQVLGRILRHNVRNDLTGVIGWAELLAEELDGEPAEWANRVQTISANLLDTTEHAREIREVVKRHGEQTTLELDAAVAEAVETARRNHPDAEITVGDGLDHTVRVHPELHRAFRHAIENGIVHDDGDGRVTVGGHDTTDGFCVTVTDEGPGIPQSELEPLAAGGETALKHGSGAGLWIIDRLLDYSGGTARYEVDETGTTVYFEFDDTAVVG
jgi:signal transduction histidine kinase